MCTSIIEYRAPFRDRADAGAALALSLSMLASEPDVIVLGLARGGVPIARQVADALHAPLEVLVVRKIGVPGIEQVALGTTVEGTDAVDTGSIAWYIGVPPAILKRLGARERLEIERRVRLYRDDHPLPDVRGRAVVLVDDGVATGATLRAAARALRARRPRRLIAAVPVASSVGVKEVKGEVDDLVTVMVSEDSQAVSAHYENFAPISDADVMRHLGRSVIARPLPFWSGERARPERRMEIPVESETIVGDLCMPPDTTDPRETGFNDEPHGLVVVVHAGGSNRDSYRDRYVAGRLRLSGYATLRLDLLTREEQARDAADASARFDVSRLANRLAMVCEWVQRRGLGGASRIVLFGSSEGAGAALCAATDSRARIEGVIAQARRTHRPRHAPEEPGDLGAVAEHAARWLDRLKTRRR